MKKGILIIGLMLLIGRISEAQTTITNASAYQVGDFLSAQYSDTSAKEGPSGAGQAWDFSSIPKVGPLAVRPIVTPSSTGYSQFTTAKMAIDAPGDNFTYLTTTDTTMEITGVVIDGKAYPYDNKEVIFKYPCSYATAFLDTFSGTYEANDVTVDRTGTVSFVSDANGTLILPTGVISSTIRIKFVEKITDIAHYGNISVTTTINSTSYFWMINSNKNRLMNITYTSLTANGITTESEDDYYYVFFTSVNDLKEAAEGLSVFPNPGHDQVRLSFDVNEGGDMHFSLEDLVGRKMKDLGNEKFSVGHHEKEFSVNELLPGIYMLRLEMENRKPTVTRLMIE